MDVELFSTFVTIVTMEETEEGDEFEVLWLRMDPQELGVISKKEMFKFVLDFMDMKVWYKDVPAIANIFVEEMS